MSDFIRIGKKVFSCKIGDFDVSDFSIVIHSEGGLKGPPVAPSSTLKAAEVLQQYIFRLTEIKLPVLFDIFPLKKDKEFLIGGTKREEDCSKGISFADEEYLIKTVDGNVVINGGKRGVLYGVYTFIEKYLGVRFLTAELERVQNRERIEVGEIDERYCPIFEYRDICDWTAWNPDFSVKNKINGNFVRKLRAEDGYSVGFCGGFQGLVHTFGHLCPADLYDENPEYFALNEQGIRDPSGLCLTNENTVKTVVKNACKWLDTEENPTMISLSVNDGNIAYCTCEKCQKLYVNGGNHTDAVLYFINKVAKRIEKKYPSVLIDTISYGKVRELPKNIKPAKNVAVRMCGYESRELSIPDAMHEVYEKQNTKPQNVVTFAEKIQEVSNVFSKIYVWDYPYNYCNINMVFPVLHTLLANVRFYADNKVKGMFINGNTDTCDFTELKVYLWAKVLYNPYMSEEEYERHLVEFLQGFYGDGWQCVYEYIRLTEELSKGTNFGIHSSPQGIIPLERAEEFIQTGKALFAKARALCLDEGERNRLKKCELQIDYYELYTKSCKQEEFAKKNKAMYDAFRNMGITRVVENTFMPVVKNFNQPLQEWEYWDGKCLTGDRNNEKYARELYVLIPVEGELGSTVSGEYLCKTNNENERGYYHYWTKDSFHKSNYNPTWESTIDYDDSFCVENATITNVYEFSKATGIPLNDMRINLIPRHLKGIMVKVEEMDAGAYVFFRKND